METSTTELVGSMRIKAKAKVKVKEKEMMAKVRVKKARVIKATTK